MKKEIHPKYVEGKVLCACGAEYTIMTTQSETKSISVPSAIPSSRASRNSWTLRGAWTASGAVTAWQRSSSCSLLLLVAVFLEQEKQP